MLETYQEVDTAGPRVRLYLTLRQPVKDSAHFEVGVLSDGIKKDSFTFALPPFSPRETLPRITYVRSFSMPTRIRYMRFPHLKITALDKDKPYGIIAEVEMQGKTKRLSTRLEVQQTGLGIRW